MISDILIDGLMDIFLECKSGVRYILQADRYLSNIEYLEQKSVSWIIRPYGNRIFRQYRQIVLLLSFNNTSNKFTSSFSKDVQTNKHTIFIILPFS